MARALAGGLGRDGRAVTAVAPGLTHAPATAGIPAAEFADTEAHQALPRPLTPDDTAALVAMLVGDEAAALTGQTLSRRWSRSALRNHRPPTVTRSLPPGARSRPWLRR